MIAVIRNIGGDILTEAHPAVALAEALAALAFSAIGRCHAYRLRYHIDLPSTVLTESS